MLLVLLLRRHLPWRGGVTRASKLEPARRLLLTVWTCSVPDLPGWTTAGRALGGRAVHAMSSGPIFEGAPRFALSPDFWVIAITYE